MPLPYLPFLTPIAQLEEAFALGASRWRFESSQKYQYRDVIQWPEALVWDQGVAGSNPVIPTTLISSTNFGLLAERICSRLLSGKIQVQPLGSPPKHKSVWQNGYASDS